MWGLSPLLSLWQRWWLFCWQFSSRQHLDTKKSGLKTSNKNDIGIKLHTNNYHAYTRSHTVTNLCLYLAYLKTGQYVACFNCRDLLLIAWSAQYWKCLDGSLCTSHSDWVVSKEWCYEAFESAFSCPCIHPSLLLIHCLTQVQPIISHALLATNVLRKVCNFERNEHKGKE